MFGSLKKRSSGFKIVDKVWLTKDAKWKACIKEARLNPETIFIGWFDETLEQLENAFAKENLTITNIFLARQATSQILQNKQFIFIEHYPVRSREVLLFQQLNTPQIQIFSALDEPLFKQIGSDKIIQLMKQLGMQETESIEHKMISDAISKIQEKINSKIVIDQSARSQDEWLSRNFRD